MESALILLWVPLPRGARYVEAVVMTMQEEGDDIVTISSLVWIQCLGTRGAHYISSQIWRTP
jgi:hypothetical protein